MDPNKYLSRDYASPPCWLLVADVVREELAATVNRFKTVNSSVQALSSTFNQRFQKDKFGFMQLDGPADLCVVFLGRNRRTKVHHAGIYYQGSILHALDDGVYFQDMASMRDQYGVMEFWGLPA